VNTSMAAAFTPVEFSPARVAKAVASVFRGAALCHGGILFLRDRRQQKIGTERHQISEELNHACDDMISAGRHPALAMAQRRATPFDLLSADDRPVDEPYFDRFVETAHKAGIDSIFMFPLRDSNGDFFVASGLRQDRPLTQIEARLIHSYCLDALAALECSQASATTDYLALTPRERQCLVAAGGGKTEKDTARELEISPSTVHAHLESCKRKLRAKNKIEAIVKAIQVGVIVPEDF